MRPSDLFSPAHDVCLSVCLCSSVLFCPPLRSAAVVCPSVLPAMSESASAGPSPSYPSDHPRVLIPELCRLFYELKWVTGTGGGVAMRYEGDYYLAPSGVQKERMQPDDLFVLREPATAEELAAASPFPLLPGRPVLTVSSPPPARRYGPSQCTPLFFEAFSARRAACCIHTHSRAAVLVTLLFDKEFRITHQEMIKGIRVGSTAASLRYYDELVVPIIDNTPEEADLTGWLRQALEDYPDTNAVLVRRHGVYVWGDSWQKAKTMCECYDYLFDAAVAMHALGVDCSQPPADSPHLSEMRTYTNRNTRGHSEVERSKARGATDGNGAVH